MQIICDGLDLSDAVLKVSKAIANKTTNPILEGIKLVAEEDTLTLSATDTELAIEKKIKAEVKIEGETVVPGKLISDFIKKLENEEEIELSLEENRLKISYSSSEGYIQTLNVEEFPLINKEIRENSFTIKQKDFKELTLVGILLIKDEVRKEAIKGIELVNKAGIQTVMITGDNKDTAIEYVLSELITTE